MTRLGRMILLSVFVLAGVGVSAHAQAPINSNVALQPSKGGLIYRQQFRYTEAGQSSSKGELDIEQATAITTLVYGVSDELTLIFDTPFVLSRRIENKTTGSDDTDSGFADMRILSKVRLYRDDFGTTDTTRFDLIGGFELPTGRDEFSSDSIDPILGGVFTHIEGRHAFHADAIWNFNTGGGDPGEDLLKYDLAYSYRLSPETFASTNPAALFGSLELNGLYETNSDNELFISPGLQYVTTRWIIEATVQLPILQDLNHRAERDFIVGIGFRVQF
ncbi:MAG: transporter [Planctomycetes bacterium]|nr:transporter [Planctomycetota bacterium]